MIGESQGCDPEAEPDLRKSEQRGRGLAREIALSFFVRISQVDVDRTPLVVEGEWNVVLNPKHPQFAQVQIADPKRFRYDQHMFR